MPAAKQAVYIEFDDAKIYALTADSASEPTYAAGIDIKNVVDMNAELVGRSATLEGDGGVDAIHTKFTHMTGTISFRSVPLDVYAIVTGGTVTQTGTTPNQTTEFSVSDGALAGYFKLAGRAAYVEGVDGVAEGMMTEVLKCKVNGNVRVISLTNEWASFDLPFAAVRTRANGKMMRTVLQETQAALS